MSAPEGIPVPRDVPATVLRSLRRRRPLWRFLSSFCRAADAAGASVFLVGGFVRDLVEGRPGKDVDLMLAGIRFAALGEILATLPAGDLGIRRIVAVGKQFPVYKVAAVWAAEDIDVGLARSERSTGPGHSRFRVRTSGVDARADASRRDFTINSLLFRFRVRGNRLGGEVIDYFGGLSDLRRKRVRGVGDPRERFREDPLRILRAIRQRNERPGYAIERRTRAAIRAAAPRLIRTIPGERMIAELVRSLSANASGTLDDLRRAGILRILLPEARGGDVPLMKRRYAVLDGSLGRPLPEPVLLACLLADIAARECLQPSLRTPDAKGFRLLRTEAIARRLHFPQVRRVVQLVEDLSRLSWSGPMVNRNARIEAIFCRWETPLWLLALYEAARTASGRSVEDFRPLLRRASRKKPLLTGTDILKMGVPAGPRVESILERVRDATLSGEVASRADAERLVALFPGAAAAPGILYRRRSRRSATSSTAIRTRRTAPPARAGKA